MDILEVRLSTSALDEQRRFYTGVLGLPLGDEADGGFALSAGHTRLAFAPAQNGVAPHYHLAFNVPGDRFAEAKAWLAARTRLLARDGEDEFAFPLWPTRAVYVHDAEGNILELIAREGIRAPDSGGGGAFGPRQLLAVSEVGLVVDDVPLVVGELETRLGLPAYGEWDEQFAAVGDARGLLIVVRRGRGWLPTGRPAEAHEASVTLRGEASGEYAPGSPYRIQVTEPNGAR